MINFAYRMKLSIITINYNNFEGLRKTIKSVINQTWQDFEWIIVDGGSTDGSRKLIEETVVFLDSRGWVTEQFSGPEDPISFMTNRSTTTNSSSPHRLLWCSEKDKGIYNAMNKGIVMVHGEYCLFLNSGDWLYNIDVLKSLCFHERKEDIFYGKNYKQEGDFNQLNFAPIYKNKLTAFDLFTYTLPHQAAFIKKSLFISYGGYDETLKIVSDWKFFVQCILFHNSSYKFIDLPVSFQQPGGISDNNQFIEERRSVLNELFPDILREDIIIANSVRNIRHNYVLRVFYSILYRLSNILKTS